MSIPKIASYPMPQAASFPAARVAWQVEPQRAVLLIHDLQDYFLDFYDTEAAPIPALLHNVLTLRNACDAAGVPVFYSAQLAKQTPLERGLLQDWWGAGLTQAPQRAAIAAPIAPQPQHTMLDKWRYSAFAKTGLRAQMQERDQIIICGVYAHIGCMMSAADAFMQDVQPFFIGDALADFSLAEHEMALDYVAKRCGIVQGVQRTVQQLADATGKAALPASQQELLQQVAGMLNLPASEIAGGDNLLHLGLDSIRIMQLLERWQRAGSSLSFIELAQSPTLADWWELLHKARG